MNSLDINNAQFFAFDISLDQLKGIAGGYDDKQGMRNQYLALYKSRRRGNVPSARLVRA